METVFASVAETEAEGARFVHTLVPQETGATLVTLSGELGAGKTTFTQAVARALGVTEHVTSPTFVLMKIYSLPASVAFRQLVHIDAYRLEGGKDLAALGFDEIMQDAGNLVLLEWPEKVQDKLPPAAHALSLAIKIDGSHTMTYA
jgi:tRNA threonylcarbamoyladenosine biosynthesis protein TsaE